MEKIKILFILENLSVGGAERVLVNLVNNMDSERFDISVLTLFSDGLNADSLKNNIKYISLKRKKFKGIRRLRGAWFSRFEWAFADHPLDLAACIRASHPGAVVKRTLAEKDLHIG